MVDRRTKEYKAAQSGEIAPVRRRSEADVASALGAVSTGEQAARPVEATATSEAVPTSQRRKRASAGGFKVKLDAPKRPGYVRRFVKNDPSRILAMQELGYDFAEADTRTDDLGTRITRYAGKSEHGAPEHLILMETPESEYAIGVAEKEEQRQPFEQALRAGRATSGELTDPYEPRQDRSSLTHTAR